MILLWSDVIIENLGCVVNQVILLFVELIINKVLQISPLTWFLYMLTSCSFWLRIFYLQMVISIHEVFLVVNTIILVLSSFRAIVAIIFLKKTLNH